jgi:hypothetical protein
MSLNHYLAPISLLWIGSSSKSTLILCMVCLLISRLKKNAFAARSSSLRDLHGEISAIDTRISMTQSNIVKNEQEITKGNSRLAPYCPDGQRFPDVLKDSEQDLLDKRTNQVALESGNSFFGGIIKSFERKQCCKTCNRGFGSEEEGSAFLLSVLLLMINET